jgi:hypothetical protein
MSNRSARSLHGSAATVNVAWHLRGPGPANQAFVTIDPDTSENQFPVSPGMG